MDIQYVTSLPLESLISCEITEFPQCLYRSKIECYSRDYKATFVEIESIIERTLTIGEVSAI